MNIVNAVGCSEVVHGTRLEFASAKARHRLDHPSSWAAGNPRVGRVSPSGPLEPPRVECDFFFNEDFYSGPSTCVHFVRINILIVFHQYRVVESGGTTMQQQRARYLGFCSYGP